MKKSIISIVAILIAVFVSGCATGGVSLSGALLPGQPGVAVYNNLHPSTGVELVVLRDHRDFTTEDEAVVLRPGDRALVPRRWLSHDYRKLAITLHARDTQTGEYRGVAVEEFVFYDRRGNLIPGYTWVVEGYRPAAGSPEHRLQHRRSRW